MIPFYNGADGLDELLNILIPSLDNLNRCWEIIFIDDHSEDNGFEIIRSHKRKDPRIQGVRLSENRGQQNALFCGICRAKGSLIVTMDDDLQHPVDVLSELLSRIEEGWDAVYAVHRDKDRSVILRTGTSLTDIFFRLFVRKPAGVEIGSYRIMTRDLVDRFRQASGDFVYISALIFRSSPMPKVFSFRYKGFQDVQKKYSRFSLTGRIKLFGKLFLYYGPIHRGQAQQLKPFQIEEIL